MTTAEAAAVLSLTAVTGDGAPREITGCYIGDLLSHAMVKAAKGDAWITVMGNVNAVAVAHRTSAACIILCDGAVLDCDAAEEADRHGIAVYASPQSAYALATRISALLK